MTTRTHRPAGFTIVELLIVIVVIGILAAITIVAFNGIQERARMNQTVSTVSQWAKLIKMYHVDNGSFPTMTSCLGTGYGKGLSGAESTGGECRQDRVDGGAIATNPSFVAAMNKYMDGAGPTPALDTVNTSTGYPFYRGAYFYPAYTSGTTVSPARIDFAIKGGSTCPDVAGLQVVAPQILVNGIKCTAYFTEG